MALVVFALGIGSALSGTLFKNVKLGHRELLEITDEILISWLLPVVALGTVLFLARRVPDAAKKDEFIDQRSLVSMQMYPTWLMMVKYLVPTLILMLLILQVVIALRN